MLWKHYWVAQPEHGGFYQALADNEYSNCGLDLQIVQGGPNSNNRAKLITKKNHKKEFYRKNNLKN